MKKIVIASLLLISIQLVKAQTVDTENTIAYTENHLKFSDLTEEEKNEAIVAFINNDCTYKGFKLWGKVKFVTSFPDIKIQYVESFPDIKVKMVTSFPDKCGLWQVVESFPDIKVQIVTSFPDIKVKIVDSFPGIK